MSVSVHGVLFNSLMWQLLLLYTQLQVDGIQPAAFGASALDLDHHSTQALHRVWVLLTPMIFLMLWTVSQGFFLDLNAIGSLVSFVEIIFRIFVVLLTGMLNHPWLSVFTGL